MLLSPGSCGITDPNAAAHIIIAHVTAIIFMRHIIPQVNALRFFLFRSASRFAPRTRNGQHTGLKRTGHDSG